MDATEPTTRLDPPNDPAAQAGADAEPGAEGDLVEEISIDGMCGVY
jgi:mycofactocin precursor